MIVRARHALATLTLALVACAHSAPAPAPDAGAPELDIPQGYSASTRVDGDIDGDGHIDALVVLERSPGRRDALESRALLLVSGRDGFQVLAPRAVLCRQCGGMFGDPLQGVQVLSSGFTLRFEGGSRELWSQEFEFASDRDQRTWTMVRQVDVVTDRLTGETRRTERAAPDLTPVDIRAFDPAELPAE